MTMDDGEICRSYVLAKYPDKQIRILAELNDCRTTQIIKILEENNVQIKR